MVSHWKFFFGGIIAWIITAALSEAGAGGVSLWLGFLIGVVLIVAAVFKYEESR